MTTNPLTLPKVAPGTILPQTSSVALDERSLSLAQVLRGLHQRGRLLPLLREAAVAHLLQEQAASLGLSVTTAELQQATDDFRCRQGLMSAENTQIWLARQRLSVQDFEAALERDLLVEKLKDHLTRDRIAGHFAAHQDGYARARLRQIVVAREDLARELLSQLQERRDFAQLARQHSQHPSGSEGGAVGEVFRRQFPAEIADAVFAARSDEVVGPLATPQGFLLLLVEEVRPAELNLQTTAAIRQELFEKWLNEQLKTVTITYPLLDNL